MGVSEVSPLAKEGPPKPSEPENQFQADKLVASSTKPVGQATSNSRDRVTHTLQAPAASNQDEEMEPQAEDRCHIVTLFGRQLLVGDDDERRSLYALARRWVKNDPEAIDDLVLHAEPKRRPARAPEE
eukprot:CAMPEP_0177603440 /NCGR_PEP_ID=MMETSP0419_2-20121207/15515_1 /TAXON_ID=582737 /ORGANISM="Tetraselmis sp., Strain GSL018" /LENGTH=127 /DNA_ID=CAMNT_0019097215 /DNA_START=52 /DNA_END=432 /DNA_ORIENTATION=-